MRLLRLFGPVCVEQIQQQPHQGSSIEQVQPPRFRSRRTIALLGYLVVERRAVARDHLAALFWPDQSSSKGRANLRRELHNLARVLPDCWQVDRKGAAFAPSPDTSVDLYELERLALEERWEEAAELIGGEFLEGIYLDDNPTLENWLLAEREHWRSRAEAVFKHVIEGRVQRGQYPDALQYAQRLLQVAPWDEATHRLIMRLLAWTGQRGAALRQFEQCCHILAEELGVEPSPEAVALYQQIQSGQHSLPPQLPAFLNRAKARHDFEAAPFFGREAESARLDCFLNQALAGNGKVIFITGSPGRGKTALMDEFAQRAMLQYPNLLVAGGRCSAYTGVGDPFLPYRELMTMLTGDVESRWDAGTISRDHARRLWSAFPFVVAVLLEQGPHLLNIIVPGAALLSRAVTAGEETAPWLPQLREQVARHALSDREVEQLHLFQQFTQVLLCVAQRYPLLLILDDLQWADAASISLLFHLGRQLSEIDNRLLIACAYRPEEVAIGQDGQSHPLAKVLTEFKRSFGDIWLHLGNQDQTAARRFVDALLDSEPNHLGESFRETLVKRTEGHPLFTLALLEEMTSRSALRKDADGAWNADPELDWELFPAQVEAVINEMAASLSDESLRSSFRKGAHGILEKAKTT